MADGDIGATDKFARKTQTNLDAWCRPVTHGGLRV